MKAQAKSRAWSTFGLTTRLVIITSVIATVGALAMLATASYQFASVGLVGIAMLVCIASSIAAHIVGDLQGDGEDFAIRLAPSVAVRTAPPFLLVLIVKLNESLPFESGFVFSVILFYLVGLFVDVAMHVARLNPAD